MTQIAGGILPAFNIRLMPNNRQLYKRTKARIKLAYERRNLLVEFFIQGKY